MRYLIYSRVSTDLQDVRTQEKMCLDFIDSKQRGEPYSYEIFSDPDTSSRIKMQKREGLMKMLDTLKKDSQVIVYKLDRLSRDIIEMVSIYRKIKEKKGFIHSLNDSNCDDEFIMSVMGALAQKERSTLVTRIKDKMNFKKKCNERVSRHLPYGFSLMEDGVHLQLESHEQQVLEVMKVLLAEGMSYRLIAQELTAKGYRNRVGKPFQHMSIYRILCRTEQTKSLGQSLKATEAHLLRL